MKTSTALRMRAVRLATTGFALIVAAAATPADDHRPGYDLYVQFQCYQCHGYEGQGGTPGGPRIASPAYEFETFAARTRHTNLMPAYSPNVLSDEDLRVIYDYVASIPEPPAVEDIPILRDAMQDEE